MMSKAWSVWPQDGRAEECIEYFKAHPVFAKVLAGFREKYVSYGAFAGTVTLKCLKEQELEDLEGFFRKNYHGKKAVSVSAAGFAKALRESRFAGLEPKLLLELYFNEKMSGRREQKQEEQARWGQALVDAKAAYEGTPAAEWLAQVQEGRKAAGTVLLRRAWEAGRDVREVRRLLQLGAEIVNGLPVRRGRTEYLAVFAAELTGNPHAFDVKTKDGQFLYQLVQWFLEQQNVRMEKSGIFPALQRQREYFAAGILVDDISNYVMLSGVHARKKNAELHSGMEGFFQEGDMLHVPLSVIADWQQVECPGGEIYIMENPSVYAMFAGKRKGRQAAMCMNGQPRLSSILLLDLLAKAGTKVYYAGDFDPEGLLIAQKVKQYYRGAFACWHMSVPEYQRSLSKETISEKRLKMLQRITDAELQPLAQAVAGKKTAGYQENIWREFAEAGG